MQFARLLEIEDKGDVDLAVLDKGDLCIDMNGKFSSGLTIFPSMLQIDFNKLLTQNKLQNT